MILIPTIYFITDWTDLYYAVRRDDIDRLGVVEFGGTTEFYLTLDLTIAISRDRIGVKISHSSTPRFADCVMLLD